MRPAGMHHTGPDTAATVHHIEGAEQRTVAAELRTELERKPAVLVGGTTADPETVEVGNPAEVVEGRVAAGVDSRQPGGKVGVQVGAGSHHTGVVGMAHEAYARVAAGGIVDALLTTCSGAALFKTEHTSRAGCTYFGEVCCQVLTTCPQHFQRASAPSNLGVLSCP